MSRATKGYETPAAIHYCLYCEEVVQVRYPDKAGRKTHHRSWVDEEGAADSTRCGPVMRYVRENEPVSGMPKRM